MTVPLQYVTLVPSGGTPVRLADQNGAPYPTTGSGALVFSVSPTISSPTFIGDVVIPALIGNLSLTGNLTVTGNITYTGTLSGPFNSPLTTRGDLYYFGAGGNTRLPLGSNTFTLQSNGTDAVWAASTSSHSLAPGRRCLLMGDSITENCSTVSLMANPWPTYVIASQNDSWFGWANRLTGQRLYLNPTLNKGIGGNTTAQMLARYATDVAANYSSFDIMFLMGGTNDITNGSSMTTAFTNLQTMAQSALAAGKQVVLMGPIPRTSTNSPSSTELLNTITLQTALREWAIQTPGVVWVDPIRAMTDPTSGTNGFGLSVLYHGDGEHPSGGGAFRMGYWVAQAINVLEAPGPTWVASQGDTYDATANPNGNRAVNGCFTVTTGGTVVNGSGTMPLHWTLQKLNGSWINSEVVASATVNGQGVNAFAGNSLNIAVAMAGRTNNETFFVINTNQITSFVPGDQIVAECEMDISGISNMWWANLGFLDSDGAQFPTVAWDGYDPYGPASANLNLWDPQTYTGMVFRTPIYTVVKGTQIFVKVTCSFNATVSAGATIAIRGMTIRKVG